MSKNKPRARQQPIPNAKPQMPPAAYPLSMQLGYDPAGPSQPVDIISTKEGWSEFNLEDGTVIRAKSVLLDVKKMIGQFNAEGDPIYALQMILTNQTKVPDHLKKKA
jgi:hypothetical protein